MINSKVYLEITQGLNQLTNKILSEKEFYSRILEDL